MSVIRHAARLAAISHEGQLRKYTGRPYIEHPMRVAGRVAISGNPVVTDDAICAAWLHDVLEDTTCKPDAIQQLCSATTLEYVNWLTNPSKEHPDLPRAVRKEMDRKHAAEAPGVVKLIKLADRLDNLLEMDKAPFGFLRMYINESKALFEVIKGADADLALQLEARIRVMDAELSALELHYDAK